MNDQAAVEILKEPAV